MGPLGLPPGGGGPGGCLQGSVFGLTGELPRKELQATLKTHGATAMIRVQQVSAIIHKRVSYVLCTPDAIKYNTQKVRKAIKHGIPLVSQGFIAACVLKGRVVDPAPFRVTAAITSTTTATTTGVTAAMATRSDPSIPAASSAVGRKGLTIGSSSSSSSSGGRGRAETDNDTGGLNTTTTEGISEKKRLRRRRQRQLEKKVESKKGTPSREEQAARPGPGDRSDGSGSGEGCVGTPVAAEGASADPKKRREGKKATATRMTEGKGSKRGVVADGIGAADPFSDVDGGGVACQKGTKRPKKSSDKNKKEVDVRVVADAAEDVVVKQKRNKKERKEQKKKRHESTERKK
ncbi:unnamed protein product [Pylaiella littoralis]